MTDAASPHEVVRPLRRARQVREFTDQPLTDGELEAITDVARWTGSSRIAAGMLELAAGIAWVRLDVLPAAREILGLPPDRMVRTLMALGHPTPAARKPKSPRGQARLPRHEVVFSEALPPD